MKHYQICRGCRLHIHKTEKFKEVTLALNFMKDISKADRAGMFLLSFLLSDSCRAYQTKQEVQALFDNLYGASFSVANDPRGSCDLLEMTVTCPDSAYLEEDILEKQFEILSQFALEPRMENGLFDENLFRECRLKAVESVNMLNDDPAYYANERAAALYGGSYAMRCTPSAEELLDISNEKCSAVYRDLVGRGNTDLFILGNVDEEACLSYMKKYFPLKDRDSFFDIMHLHCGRKAEIREKKQISQSSLVMLYDTGHVYTDDDMPAFMLGNGIFGALPTSMLFQEIREKNSLCYAVGSENMIFDGILRISTSMEAASINEAVRLIEKQLERMKNGDFSEQDMETAREMYIASWRSSMDHVPSLIWDDYRSVILGRDDPVSDMIRRFNETTRQQIIDAWSTLALKTVYILEQEASDEEVQ